jgi:hypothetical protein
VAKEIGPIAKPKDIRFGENLPKTRSGKIMRRLLRSIAKGEAITQDTSTLENPPSWSSWVTSSRRAATARLQWLAKALLPVRWSPAAASPPRQGPPCGPSPEAENPGCQSTRLWR